MWLSESLVRHHTTPFPDFLNLNGSIYFKMEKRRLTRREYNQVIIGFVMTSLIPMVDVWPGLHLWYSYSAYNRFQNLRRFDIPEIF